MIQSLSSRLFGQLLGLSNPIVARDATARSEQLVQHGDSCLVGIRQLPEMIDPQVVEVLLDLSGNSGDALEIVGFAARSIDPAEGWSLLGQHFLGRCLGRADIDTGRRLATADAIDRGTRNEIAVQRNGTAGVV